VNKDIAVDKAIEYLESKGHNDLRGSKLGDVGINLSDLSDDEDERLALKYVAGLVNKFTAQSASWWPELSDHQKHVLRAIKTGKIQHINMNLELVEVPSYEATKRMPTGRRRFEVHLESDVEIFIDTDDEVFIDHLNDLIQDMAKEQFGGGHQ